MNLVQVGQIRAGYVGQVFPCSSRTRIVIGIVVCWGRSLRRCELVLVASHETAPVAGGQVDEQICRRWRGRCRCGIGCGAGFVVGLFRWQEEKFGCASQEAVVVEHD